MKRACAVGLLATTAVSVSAVVAQQPAPAPQFRAGVDLLQLDVSMLDRDR